MPKPPMPPEVVELLLRPNPAVITTMRPDGQPVSVATWYVMDGDRILVNMDEGRKRLDYLQSDPRVSVTVLDEKGWYTHVSMQGRATEISVDEDMAGIDRIARHYTGKPYSNRSRGRVNAWIEIDRWHGWGALRNAG
jgi:PPOX class probable F420-dependent enzyme